MELTYPVNFEEKTGFDRIREMIDKHCFSSLGQKQAAEIAFLTDKDSIERLLCQAEEFRQILLAGEQFPGANYYDPDEIFDRLRLKDTFAEPEVLLDLKLSLETILAIISFLSRTNDSDLPKYPRLSDLTDGLSIDDTLPGTINRLIDEKASVRSSASPALAAIRKQKDELYVRANRQIQRILNEGKQQGWIRKDEELALRNSRQVIPVPVAYKRKLRGFIHDHSATGQTAFVEPEEVFEMNNQVRELEADERQEIVRLLKDFADHLRPMIPELRKAYHMLGQMDLIRAKAYLALDMEAMKPKITDEARLQWINARHPLLFLSYKKQKKEVVPLTVDLNRDQRILVISGPNAGGKSVCLKTCGLLQYMLQCGLLVPMDDQSTAGIFRQLLIDIGDEQSLENDLSTYSSHLVNMKYFLGHSNEKTLFLIDEFGAGTEPRIGGAIAESILTRLNELRAMGVITTHYANLKLMAGKHEGMVNGSMLFDTEKIRPLYKMKTGTPGSSFAFEIAKNIGLPGYILNNASLLAGQQDLNFDVELQNLEVRKEELDNKERQLRQADDLLSDLIDKYEKLHGEVEARKTEILQEARKEAKDILAGSNRMIENTIREIKEAGAEREKTREARSKLEKFTLEHEKDPETLSPTPSGKSRKKQNPLPVTDEIDPTPIKVGDVVRIKGQQSRGEVAEISGKQALVVFGSIKLRTSLPGLVKLRKGAARKKSTKGHNRLSFDIHEKAIKFNPDIDLRGKNSEEALKALQNHIDDAFLLGMPQIRIIHGKGEGVLRPAVRKFLAAVPQVNRYRDEHPDRGGAGITIVDFN